MFVGCAVAEWVRKRVLLFDDYPEKVTMHRTGQGQAVRHRWIVGRFIRIPLLSEGTGCGMPAGAGANAIQQKTIVSKS